MTGCCETMKDERFTKLTLMQNNGNDSSRGGGKMSTLPHLSPGGTLVTTAPPVHNIYSVYPNRLPSAPDIPKRINPLNPPLPDRRTHMLETAHPHWQNDQRSQLMKQREHYRYHNAWSKYYYGSAADKEAHRAYTRAVLKQQMTDKWSSQKRFMTDKVRESEEAVRTDLSCRMEDAIEFQKKYEYLKGFRDENKQLMENQWSNSRKKKFYDDTYDREQLKYNPINWSATLK